MEGCDIGPETMKLFADAVKAVSYTHLDVYKRQYPASASRQLVGQGWPGGIFGLPCLLQQGCGQAGPCLLYTSTIVYGAVMFLFAADPAERELLQRLLKTRRKSRL